MYGLAVLVGGVSLVMPSYVATNSESAVTPASLDSSARLGIQEFYNDPVLTDLIHQALVGNQELRILDQDIQIAGNEILARQGAYLPFVTVGGSAGAEKPSRYTYDGAVEESLELLPGRSFPRPLPSILGAFNFFWEVDITGKLHSARYAAIQRYLATCEKRNYFVTTLVADVAENYYRLMALDQRIENLNRIIALQEQSLSIAKALKDAARGTELGVQRFQGEVRKNQSEKFIVKQDIVEVENRINFLLNRFPMPVERISANFFDLNISALSVGIPAQLLQNRPDIVQAERELAAAGLDVFVARAEFFPSLSIRAGIGYQAFKPAYLFATPEALIYNAVGELVAPLINKKAIQANFLSANAAQLQSIYNYQRTVLNAYTEVVNRINAVENYRKSIEIKRQQLAALEASVDTATKLFQNVRVEYIEVLFSQRDLLDARIMLIDTKQQQLVATVNAYQALGGGNILPLPPLVQPPPPPRPLHWLFHH